MASEALLVSDSGRVTEGWNEPDGRGVIGWQTLLSADRTPTEGLTAGLATLEAGGFLALHRHAPAELYFILDGTGRVTLDGVDRSVQRGDCVFIPPMAEHGCRNDGATPLRFLYVFPTSSFTEVEYLFSPKE